MEKKNPDTARTRFFRGLRTAAYDDVRSALAKDRTLVDQYDPDHFEANPVTVAVHHGDLEMVDLLVEHGADIDRKSDWWAGGFAPIHSIPRNHRGWLLPALLERGATLDLHAAAQHGRLDRVKELLESAPERVLERGGDGQHPLHFAETVEIAAYLLQKGADLEARCIDHHSTPAQWAAADRPDVCRFLIDRGARTDIWMLAAIGATAELEAMLDTDPTILETRLGEDFQKGPDEGVMNIYHFTLDTDATPLHVAAGRGHTDLARMLMARGADMNAPGGYDQATPLHAAAWHDRVEVAKRLLDAGADIDRPSGPIHENEPVGWAIVAGRPRMVGFLMTSGATIQPWHLKDAENGIRGDHQPYTDATPDDFEKVAHMLRQSS